MRSNSVFSANSGGWDSLSRILGLFSKKSVAFISILASLAPLFLSGCSSLQLPTFDPTGKRIFSQNTTSLLTPCKGKGLFGLCKKNNQPAFDPFQPAPFSPVAAAPPPPPMPSTAPLPAGPSPSPPPRLGSVQQGPAFTHPVDPPPCDDSGCKSGKGRFLQAKHIIPKPNGAKTAGQKGELVMTPHKIIAPVGSEVVVLAGICGSDGYFVKNQPLEWMLSNDSVGQFIEVGGMQHAAFNKIVPPTAGKSSGQFALGRTGLKNILLTRGTPTPCDDIELKEGQTFISVSSVSPGTSYITGYAPKAEGWDRRIASTIIHWVDGQWSIPAPANATAGTVYPLTTVVSRTGDAGGIENWLVKYEIVGGAPAEFAPSGSKTAETTTNKSGQAVAQIRQIAGQFEPGTTQVRVDVIRPAMFGQPELVVESGLTTVTWSAPALTIRSIGPKTAGLNEPFNYRVEVLNPGDQIARDVVVRTKNLDESLEFISANPKPTEFGRQLEWKLGDIAPGSAVRTIDVQLKSRKRGNAGVCFEVVSETDRLRTEACSETEIAVPCIGLNIDGPTVARVGETLDFKLNVNNQCNEPLESVRLTIRTDQGLIMQGYSNPVTFELEQLQANENRALPLKLVAQGLGPKCFDVEIVAKNGHSSKARRCVEIGERSIEQVRDQLQIELRGGNPIQIGGETLVTATVTNRGNAPLDSVFLNILNSPSLNAVGLTDGLRSERLRDEELLVSLGTLNPQQSKEVQVSFEGMNVDATAFAEFTATNPLGAQAKEKINIDVRAAGANEGPIGIPRDPVGGVVPGNGELAIQMRSGANRIRLFNQADPGSSETPVEIVISNNTQQPIPNLKVTMYLTAGLRLLNPDLEKNNVLQLDNDNRNDSFTEFYFVPIGVLRPGETLRTTALIGGGEIGNKVFGIDATSSDGTNARNALDIEVVQ